MDLKYKHKQDAISDFDNEKLLPHALSTDAPKLAVGDVDGDGLADVFVGGNSGKLFFQTKSGNYTEGSLTVPNVAAAAFFDADGDGDLDLYVTCRVDAKEPLPYDEKIVPLMDRLFLNDGKGKFKMQGELPPHNGSCVRAADFDGDGDLDLFVGSRSDLKEYGLSPKSFLLQNDGKGNFKNVTPQYCPLLDSIGMVTDAVWTDMNGDGKPDLVVVGEWMPITILMNRGDDFEPIEIENTSGWWKTVAAADLNGDGKPDLVVGNMGLNSNWQASPAEPMGLYVKDFDGNGDLEPIISYWRQGIEWVYASKDELTAQMPSLRKRFPDYAPFAKSPFDKVFPKEIRNGAVEKHIQQFASVVLMNKGGGELELKKLPSEVQFSTVEAILIEDFDGDGAADIAIGGNFYEMQPSIGRFDASFGSILKGDGVGNFTPQNALETNFILRGAVRDIKRVGNMIFVAANGQPLQVFELKKREKKRE